MSCCSLDFDFIGALGATVGYLWAKTLICYSGATTSTPVRNLTGYTADMEVRSSDGTLAARISTTAGSNGSITITGASGSIALLISAAHMGTLSPGLYRYELRLVDGSGNATKLFVGKFEIAPKLIGAATP